MEESLISRLIQYVQTENPDLWWYAVRQIETEISTSRGWGLFWFFLFLVFLAPSAYIVVGGDSVRERYDWTLDDAFFYAFVPAVIAGIFFVVTAGSFANAAGLSDDVNTQALYWLLREMK